MNLDYVAEVFSDASATCVWIQIIKRGGITNMNEKGTALLLVSEGLNNHPSYIIDIVELLVKREYESVVVLPYPDHFKKMTIPDHIRKEAIDKVFSKANVAAIIHVEKDAFIESLFDNKTTKQLLKKKGINIEDYSEMIKPLMERVQHVSSQGRDALLIYKARTDNPTKEVEFLAAMQVCEMHGAVGVAVLVYKELPISNKQEWVNQINVLEPGFICTNVENDFIHELLNETNIPGADVAVITTIASVNSQTSQEEPDIKKMN